MMSAEKEEIFYGQHRRTVLMGWIFLQVWGIFLNSNSLAHSTREIHSPKTNKLILFFPPLLYFRKLYQFFLYMPRNNGLINIGSRWACVGEMSTKHLYISQPNKVTFNNIDRRSRKIYIYRNRQIPTFSSLAGDVKWRKWATNWWQIHLSLSNSNIEKRHREMYRNIVGQMVA